MLPVGKLQSKQSYKSSPIRKAVAEKNLGTLAILLAAGCLTTMTGGIVSPVLPEMVAQLEFDPRWAGMLVSVHAIAIAIFTPIMGILSDRVGKFRVMVVSLVFYTLFGVAGAFIPSLAVLLVVRFFLGVSSGGIAAAAIGFLGTLYEGSARSRVLGVATSAMTTTSILVPLLGGWVGKTHWEYAFYLYGLGIPLAVVVALNLRNKHRGSSSAIEGSQLTQLGELVRQPSILSLYLILAVAAMVVYAVVIYTPLYLKDAIGATPDLNGLVLAVRGIGAAIVSAVLASRVAKLMGPQRAIALGFILMAVTLATIPLLTQIQLILITAVLFGSGFGVITPTTYNALANQAPAELRSSVLSIGTGFNSLGQFVSPLLLGPIWKYAGLPVVLYTAAGIAFLFGVLSLLRETANSTYTHTNSL